MAADEAKEMAMAGLEKEAKPKKAKKPEKAEKSEKKESKSESKESKKGAKKSGKHIREMRVRKSTNGGFIVEHHHEPDASGMTPPMEEYAHPHLAAVHDHMEEHMGDENPGEAEANAGSESGEAPASNAPATPTDAMMA